MDSAQKRKKYQNITKSIAAVTAGEENIIAKMATISCLLKSEFDYYYWCGFYLVDKVKQNQLVIGPYQGTLGCLRIPFGKGVCGVAAKSEQTQVVENVHELENHIACDAASTSEIVVPLMINGELHAVLDVDSTDVASFNDVDKQALENILKLAFT
ncbi:MAG: diguanylate phosphodiesterase [Bacteriovorax sp. MedPE-SWde]|nr:MAG: diguanylate phosphodiesterase [Bacteriovorax sp. MedPE-SWde]